eukprot:CAMPEP_0182429134 /NCGR_PEP_ID=MMETSP1167-20130531/25538_1 /TAXON_ID=2988 /ORGANISM="Mallomonas Sp, Strain CCMP3275" /LENGTH=393 /DNA_ID=CAMNT_0024612481 /DNA_START=133 /DNA_END=1314 /DNA_ORIENTATION=-
MEEDDGEYSDSKRQKCGDEDSKLKLQDQIDRRREQNRVLARRTRQRKKNFFESLQKQAEELLKENEMLKGLVKAQSTEEINSEAVTPSGAGSEKMAKVTASGAGAGQKPSTGTDTSVSQALSQLGSDDKRLLAIIQTSQRSYCITNPHLADNPIIFANKTFLDLTGYRLDQVLGRNCRFLQGPGTDPRQVEILRKGISMGVDTSVCFLNYRADGSTFTNQMFVAPLRDTNNNIINYVGVQVQLISSSETEAMELRAKRASLMDFLKVSSSSTKSTCSGVSGGVTSLAPGGQGVRGTMTSIETASHQPKNRSTATNISRHETVTVQTSQPPSPLRSQPTDTLDDGVSETETQQAEETSNQALMQDLQQLSDDDDDPLSFDFDDFLQSSLQDPTT